MKLLPLVAVSLAFAVGAATARTEAPAAAPAAKPAAEPSDASALATLNAVNQHEVESARMARSKGVGGEVLRYSTMLEQEHSSNDARTRQLAESESITPIETPDVTAMKQAAEEKREKLAALEGEQFSDAYLQMMLQDHSEALNTIDNKLLPAARDPEVIAHLKQTREHIAKHLDQARALADNTDTDD